MAKTNSERAFVGRLAGRKDQDRKGNSVRMGYARRCSSMCECSILLCALLLFMRLVSYSSDIVAA